MASTKKKWNERNTVRFLELYEAEEVLWNVRLREYKNKDTRNAAIQRLIHNLDIDELTIQDVNTKINNIRSTYAQEKAKIKKSTGTGSGVDDIYTPSLAWFEIADRFLSGVIKSRKTYQNVANSNECSSDMPASPSPDIPVSLSPDIPASSLPDIRANPSPDIPAISSPDIPDSAQFVAPLSKKRIKKTLPQHITKTIETLESIKNQAIQNREIEDEFYHFGKNIASQLRQLPLVDALDVQSDMLNLIKMKRQSILRNSEQTNSPSNESLSEYYAIEIPEDIIITQEEITAPETNNVLENEVQDIEMPEDIIITQEETTSPETNNMLENDVQDTALELAIRSIGGFIQTPEK